MHFEEDSSTVKNSFTFLTLFLSPPSLKKTQLVKAGSVVTVWVRCKGEGGLVLIAACRVLCPPL